VSYNYELALLPERKVDRRFVAAGYAFLAFMIAAMTFAPLVWPDRLNLPKYSRATELIPPPELRPEPPPPAEVKPVVKVEIPPVVVEAPKIVLRHDVPIPKPEPEKAPEVAVQPMPAPEIKFAPVVPRAPRVVQSVDLGFAAHPTLKPSVQNIQTGGFTDPNGIAGTGKPNARLTIANTGAFDSSPSSGTKNSTGQHGTVASGGFGSEVAQSGPSHASGQLQTGGFSAQAVGQGSGPKKRVDTGSATSEVQITFKPTPAYTADARQLRIEGEVLLEIMFGANGQLHVNRVVRGLGHGLDESAIAAAKQMQYKPALNNGQPVDSTAVVHVTFQLAY
jgi:TonB family protein